MTTLLPRKYLLAALLMLLPVAGQATTDISHRIRDYVGRISSGAPLQIEHSNITSARILPVIYEKHAYQPIWDNQATVRQLVSGLASSDLDGLDPGDYHLEDIRRLLQGQEAHSGQDRQAEIDVLLTDGLIRLCYHLLFGKLDPEALDPHWNMNRTLPGPDPVAALTAGIDTGRVHELIDSFRPRHPVYRNLKTALARYREIEAQGGWPVVPGGATLKPGMQDARIPVLRKRLNSSGDMPQADQDSMRFDGAVEDGVRRFQLRHGLDTDGVVGPATLKSLNVPVSQRVDMIRVNLERSRWILHDLPGEFVVVDIAGFNARYFRDDNVVWKGRAVVGKPYRKTPVFRDQIRYIEFNPAWTVPPTILRKDVLPAIKRNPDYLASSNMHVIDHMGRPVDVATIDWSRYPEQSFPYLIRQEPGPGNPLGRMKFMFPNKYQVYLHDTPGKTLFERSGRAFSSGCIRIENPLDLAERLLEKNPGWNRSRILQEIDKGKTSRVNLLNPVTVMLLYWTVAVDADGTVRFKNDIYQRDTAVLKGLK